MTEGGVLEPDQSQPSPPSALHPVENSDGVHASEYHIMRRPGSGSSGHHIPVLVNHLKVYIESSDVVFYQYNVKFQLVAIVSS